MVIDCHFIKEKIEGGTISLVYTPTALQIVDILTKPLSKTNFEDLRYDQHLQPNLRGSMEIWRKSRMYSYVHNCVTTTLVL